MLKPSALNRVISPLIIGMFFESCMFGVWLFIPADSVQHVGQKEKHFYREFVTNLTRSWKKQMHY